ncbi:MAG: ChaN family lipoprotein [Candidatus Cloacimonetes bacterium]|nr:ChaN family lipoprotein [Candidatus Cloacimonadota bacterium]
MRKLILTMILVMILNILYSDNLTAYKIYTAEGVETDFSEMINKLVKADVILFGELHDNPIAHWLELEVTKALYEIAGENLILGAEMFEADNQLIIDEYLQGLIKTNHFEENIRLWNNYSTDYKPLVEFAVEKKLYLVATNIPRRYAKKVARGGFEALRTLSKEAKKYIAPLPIEYNGELACYKKMISMSGMPGQMHADNLPRAQAIKDATMAYFISRNISRQGKFLHFNGRYHSDFQESIVWYLKKYAPELMVMTIATTLNDTLTIPEEDRNAADFIIVIPENMTRTY